MHRTVYLYSGKATPIEEAGSKIRSLVDAGTPLSTKEVLRDVSRQPKSSNMKGQKISVKGLYGVIVESDIETGDTRKSREPVLNSLCRCLFLL
jgi:hypothetical protein